MIQKLSPFLYLLTYLFLWGIASYYIHKRISKKNRPSKVIVIGGGFLALNFSAAILLSLGLLVTGNFPNSLSTSSPHPEQILNGVNLEATKDEILKSYSKGFDNCSDFNEREICIWKEGSQSFDIIYFYNQKISQINFKQPESSFKDREAILQYSQPTVEPIRTGFKFDNNHTNAGFQGFGLDRMEEGDYYLFGCRAYRPYYKGKLKILGLGGENFFINECSEETFEYLKSDSLIYESNEYSQQIQV